MADAVEISLKARDQASSVLQQVEQQLLGIAETLTAAGGVIASSVEAAAAARLLEDSLAGTAATGQAAFEGLSSSASAAATQVGALPSQVGIDVIARDEASATLKNIDQAIQSLSSRITGAGGLVAGGVLAVIGSKLLIGTVSKATEAYLAQEKAARGLTDAQLDFSESLQRTIGIQDEVVNGAMRQARMLGVQDGLIQDVTKAAIGLSQATGMSLQSAIMKVNEAINGNANAFASYIPEIRNAETESEKLALISEAAARGLEREAETSNEVEGALARRKAATEDLMAAIGSLMAPSIEFQNTLAAVATVAADVIRSIADSFGQGSGFMSTAIKGFATVAVGAFAFVETAIKNFWSVVEITTATVELAALQWGGAIEHVLTKEIPAYAAWFADNFLNLMTDAANAVITVFQNLGHNIGEVIAAIWVWVSSGMEGGVSGLSRQLGQTMMKDLLEGFESQTEPLPDIIGRQITDREQDLANQIAELGGKLGSSFSDTFNERMEQVNQTLENFNQQFELDTQVNLQAALDAQASASDTGALQAVEGRLLTRGETDTPMDQIVTFTERTAKGVEKLPEKLGAAVVDGMRRAQNTLGNDTIDIRFIT